jgi:hypothetical protein
MPQTELNRTEEIFHDQLRKPTYEEFVAAMERLRATIRQHVPENWDPVAELIKERRAAAAAGE